MRGVGRHLLWATAVMLVMTAAPVEARGPPPQLQSLDPAAGPTAGGAQVTLTGKHLSETTAVRFDGTAVAFESLGNDRLRATAPAHAAGDIQVVVTTPGGSAQLPFRYVAPPTIESTAPDRGQATGGDEVTIQGTGLGETAAVWFGQASATSFEIVDDGTVRAVTPQHAAGTVKLRVETSYGTASRPFTFIDASVRPTIESVTPSEGPTAGGTEVVIDGSALSATTGVFFDGLTTSFEVLDAGRVQVVSPAHAAGTVEVRIETPNGSASHSFTYLAAGGEAMGVTIEQLEPDSGPTAGGTQVNITGRGMTNVTAVAFGGVDAQSWIAETDARLVAVTPPHAAGTVQVELQHADGTASAPFIFEADPDPAGSSTASASASPSPTPTPTAAPTGADSKTPTGSGPTAEALQAVADPVQSGIPADVVRSGAPAVPGSGTCWVLLAASTPGQRVVVPFSESCDVEAVVVKVPAGGGLLNVSVHSLAELPDHVPAPGIVHGPGLVFEAIIRDVAGNEVSPEGAVLQVRMPGAWLDECPPAACATDLFHYDGQAWSMHAMRAVDQADGFLVLQADVSSFSLFAVGGTPLPPMDATVLWLWPWFAGGVAMVGAPAAVGMLRRRAAQRDPKVGMLLREMSDKEELLQFLNNAAHDLANPLTPIQLQLDVLTHAADDTDPEEQRRALRRVQQNVEQMTMLVGDLRDAAKVRSGRLRFFPAEHALGEVMAQAVAMMEAQAAQAGVSLVYEPPEGDVPAHIDRGRILQVVANLLGNAIKFTPKGGSVELTVEPRGATAHVRVTDTGLGLAPDEQARLFEPFSQAHGDKEKARGTGLGLYISKGIVEAHDGSIGCHSDGRGTGSTFWFTLPLQPTADGGRKP